MNETGGGVTKETADAYNNKWVKRDMADLRKQIDQLQTDNARLQHLAEEEQRLSEKWFTKVEGLEKTYTDITAYLEEQIKNKTAYIEAMKRICKTEELYDQAQTNIMETKQQLIDYNWINTRIAQALRPEAKKGE